MVTHGNWLRGAARLFAALGLAAVVGCGGELEGAERSGETQDVSLALMQQRSDAIKAVHASHAYVHNPVLFAGIAYAETQMAHCYSEYTSQVSAYACQGPASASCGNGAVTAGYWDGACSLQQGGLGMFQFDEGTHTQTLAKWSSSGYWGGQPRNILDLNGNIAASIDFVLFKAWYSGYTPYFASNQTMYDWINAIRPVNGDSNYELWLGFLANSYNGLAWGSAGWSTVKEDYRAATTKVFNDLGGNAYWYSTSNPSVPALPTNVVATALDANRIQVTWVENSNQTGFRVTDGGTTVTLGATARSYTWTGLAPGTYKCTAVQAYNAAGSSAYTAWACTTTPTSSGPPALPTNVVATALDANRIQITWVENSNQTGFRLTNGGTTVTLGATARSYVWTGLAPGTYQCHAVQAYNAAGSSAWTAWACTTTPTSSGPPALPTNVVATALDANRIQITWVENSNQTGFRLTNGGTTVTLGATARSYVWTGLAPGTYQCHAVQAYNAAGSSAWTAWACTTTPQSSTTPIAVPYLSQYGGQASQNSDCGPAAVAMIVQHRNLRPAGLTDGAFMTQVRRNAGVWDDTSYTSFGNLEAALGSYGLGWSEITASLSPQPAAQFQAMADATRTGKPVIALVNGPTLGRGSGYGDHWVVVRGVSADGNTVYLNDPDNQAARWTGWIVGGQITLDATTFKNALYNAAPGSYGIVVN